MEAGREFQFLKVIGTNVLAKEVVRHLSNLTAKECWESAKECWESAKECWESAKRVLRAKHALGGIIDFNSNLLYSLYIIILYEYVYLHQAEDNLIDFCFWIGLFLLIHSDFLGLYYSSRISLPSDIIKTRFHWTPWPLNSDLNFLKFISNLLLLRTLCKLHSWLIFPKFIFWMSKNNQRRARSF